MKKLVSNSRALPWFMAVLLSALVTACGGGSGGQEPILGSGGAQGAPTVTAVTPAANATNVPIGTKAITATFSKSMDATTLSATSFTLACPTGSAVTGGTYSVTGNVATLTLPATTNLPADTLCTATVSSAAKDTVGIALASNYSWSFRTVETIAPTVSSTFPLLGSSNVPLNTSTSIIFSEPMNPSTIVASNISLMTSLSGTAVPGTVSYAGLTAVFTPTAPLSIDTRYTVTVKGGAAGVTDLAGNPMVSDFTNTWTTRAFFDNTAPTVIHTINADGAINVPINTKIGATFSEAMNPVMFTPLNFLVKQTVSGAAVAGSVVAIGPNAVYTPTSNLAPSTKYTITVKGAPSGVTDLVGNPMALDYVWSWTTSSQTDFTAPTVITVNPLDLATNVSISQAVNATFSEPMDAATIGANSFSVAGVAGLVSFNALTKVATFTPSSGLSYSTTYTATVNTQVKDIAGNAMAQNKVWSFTTEAAPVVVVIPPSLNLGSASTYGTFGGTAGMTNTGTLTLINGDIGTIATATGSITGFHDTSGDIYTEVVGTNVGPVNGKIYTCAQSTTGPTSAGVNAANCAKATQARLDAQTAYLALVAKPPILPPLGANLSSITLLPGVYKSTDGTFLIDAGNLTLDAQGDANAVWVFQMATTLTVGAAAVPRSIILAGGAQSKNVYWQVGSFATINPSGGGTMVGTIISQTGASFSTVGNTTIVNLNGRVLSLGASVTLVDTVINVP